MHIFPSSKHIELLGTISPKPCPVKSKYNKAGAIKKTLFEAHDIPEGMASLMAETANMALAQNTKSNYETVKNNIERCSAALQKDMSFPWDTSKTLNFVGYLLYDRKVMAKTANMQLSGVRMAHIESGHDCPCLRPPIIALLLKGKEHWDNAAVRMENSQTRAPVTIDMMKMIKRELHKADFSFERKRMIWAVTCLNWAGSLRVHESLAKFKTTFDTQATLLGDDLTIKTVKIDGKPTKMISLRLKCTKESRIGAGTILEIFENKTFMCPIAAVEKFIESKKGSIRTDKPFFREPTGDNFTGKEFNKILASLTKKITNGSNKVIQSHSFRAGVASEMAKRNYSDSEIQAQGRWSSEAYKVYCKLPRARRLTLSNRMVIQECKN